MHEDILDAIGIVRDEVFGLASERNEATVGGQRRSVREIIPLRPVGIDTDADGLTGDTIVEEDVRVPFVSPGTRLSASSRRQ